LPFTAARLYIRSWHAPAREPDYWAIHPPFERRVLRSPHSPGPTPHTPLGSACGPGANPLKEALWQTYELASIARVSTGANFLLAGRGSFERLLKAELAVAVGVFAATGFLTSLPPASAVWHEPASPAVAPASASADERAAQVEADCRLAIYIAEQNLSRKEANEFSEVLANMKGTMKNLYATEGSLRNAALDHLGVLRYPECKEAEE
jgi:hypothetical protein